MRREEPTWLLLVALAVLMGVLALVGFAGYEAGVRDAMRTECLLRGGTTISGDNGQHCIDSRALIELRPVPPSLQQETQP